MSREIINNLILFALIIAIVLVVTKKDQDSLGTHYLENDDWAVNMARSVKTPAIPRPSSILKMDALPYRDPFIPLISTKKVAAPAPVAPAPKPIQPTQPISKPALRANINGIVVDGGGKIATAIIDSDIYKVGDSFNNYRIKKITAKAISFEDTDGDILTIGINERL